MKQKKMKTNFTALPLANFDFTAALPEISCRSDFSPAYPFKTKNRTLLSKREINVYHLSRLFSLQIVGGYERNNMRVTTSGRQKAIFSRA